MEALCVLHYLLYSFDVSMVDGQTVTYRNALTMPMKNGLKVVLTVR